MEQGMNEFTIELPYPPSTNTYWNAVPAKHGGVKYLVSREGLSYRDVVYGLLLKAGVSALEGRLAVEILVYPLPRGKRDLDNCLKAVLDSLQHGGAYLNDGQIDDLWVRRMERCPKGKLIVTIRDLSPEGPPDRIHAD